MSFGEERNPPTRQPDGEPPQSSDEDTEDGGDDGGTNPQEGQPKQPA